MSRRTASRVVVDLAAIGLFAASLIGGVAQSPVAAADGLRFIAPQTKHLSGTADLEVEAPAGTTAVRFYLDDIELAELTDLYARQTKTAPVWITATDAAWFPPGGHTLRAEADIQGGTVIASEHVITERPAPGPGVLALDGGWHFARAADLPAGALDGDDPLAAQPGYDASAWPTIVVPDSFGAVRAAWNDDNGLLTIYRRTVDLDAPQAGERT